MTARYFLESQRVDRALWFCGAEWILHHFQNGIHFEITGLFDADFDFISMIYPCIDQDTWKMVKIAKDRLDEKINRIKDTSPTEYVMLVERDNYENIGL